jgi:excisionase family DNA binding protein
MTAKITMERIGDQAVRLTLVADIQISGSLSPFTPGGAPAKAAIGLSGATRANGGSSHDHELLTVEETAEILHVGRDKIYYLLRTGQLRSIKIGKLRRVSRAWVAEFVERMEAGSA